MACRWSARSGRRRRQADSTVAIMARKQGSKGAFKSVGTSKLPSGQSVYAFTRKLAAGKWQVETVYKDGSQFVSATSASKNVTVKQGTTNVSFKKTALKKGKITVNGALSLAPAIEQGQGGPARPADEQGAWHGHVQADRQDLGRHRQEEVHDQGQAHARQLHARARYVHSVQPTTVSKLKSITVH